MKATSKPLPPRRLTEEEIIGYRDCRRYVKKLLRHLDETIQKGECPADRPATDEPLTAGMVFMSLSFRLAEAAKITLPRPTFLQLLYKCVIEPLTGEST